MNERATVTKPGQHTSLFLGLPGRNGSPMTRSPPGRSARADFSTRCRLVASSK